MQEPLAHNLHCPRPSPTLSICIWSLYIPLGPYRATLHTHRDSKRCLTIPPPRLCVCVCCTPPPLCRCSWDILTDMDLTLTRGSHSHYSKAHYQFVQAVYSWCVLCRLLIAVGLLWIVLSLVNSIVRVYVLHLLAQDTTIDLIQPLGGNK